MVLDQLFRRLRGEPEFVSVSLDGCNLGSGSVGFGGAVSVSADVVNATTDTLEANVDFTAGGQTVDSDLVSLPPGGTRTASTSLSWRQLSNWEGGSVSIGAEAGFDSASCGSVSVASAPDIDPEPDPPSWSLDSCQGVPNSLAEGESFLVSASLTNTGGQEGTVTAGLLVNGASYSGQTVTKTLSPDQTDTVNFFSLDYSELVNKFGAGSSVSISAVAGDASTNCGSVTLDDPSDQPDPASFRVDTCEGVPSELSEGEDFIPQGWITNTGDQQGTVTVEFRINGQTRQTYEDTVAPGGTVPAPFDAVSWSTLDNDFGAGQNLSTSIVAGGDSASCGSVQLLSSSGGSDDGFAVTECSNVRFDELMKMHADLTINNTQPDQMYEIVLYANGEFEGRHEYDNPGGDTISAEHAIPERLGEFYNRFSPGDEIEIGFSAHAGGLEGNSPGPECTSTVTWDPPEHPVRIDNLNPMGGIPPYDGPGSDVISFSPGGLAGITQGILEIDLTNISGRVISGLDDSGRGIPVSIDYGGITIPEDGMSLDPGRADTATLAHLPPLFSPFESTRIDATWQNPSAAQDATVSLLDSDGSVIDSITIDVDNSGAKVIKPSQCMPNPHPSWPACDGPGESCSGDHCERECVPLDIGCSTGVCRDHQCEPCEQDGDCRIREVCENGECVDPHGRDPVGPEDLSLTDCTVEPTEVFDPTDLVGLSATYRNEADVRVTAQVQWAADGTEIPAGVEQRIPPGETAEFATSIEYGKIYTAAGDQESYDIGVKAVSVSGDPEGQVAMAPVTTQLENPESCATLEVASDGGGDPPPGGDPEPGECEVNTDCPDGEICINGTCYPENTGPPGDGDGDNDWLWIAGGIAAAGAGAAAYLRQRNNGSRSNGSSRSRR